MRSLPRLARFFVATIWFLGVLALAGTGLLPSPRAEAEHWELGLFLLLGVVAGRVQVDFLRRRPDEGAGSATLGYLFTFLTLLRFGPAAAVWVGTLSTFCGCLVPKRQPWYQVAFNTALVASATLVAGTVFLWSNGGTLRLHPLQSLPAVLTAAACFFLLESGAVSTVIALSTRRDPIALWKNTFLWMAPSYLAAASAGALTVMLLGRHVGTVLLYLSPVAYLTYQSYALYAARTAEKEQHRDDLREREARLRFALRAARMGAWDLDLATRRITWYEQSAVEGAPWFGGNKTAGAIIDEDDFLAAIHPEDQETVRATFERVRTDGVLTPVAFRVASAPPQIDGDETTDNNGDADYGEHWFEIFGQAHRSGGGNEDAAGRPVRVSGVIANISERKRSEALVRWQAHHDALTGLPNRSLFLERLEQALAMAGRKQDRVAVLFVDLDRFKQINDTLGHAMGDQVLQEVARRLQGCLRVQDTIARMGGDEFTVLLPGLPHSHAATTVVQKLHGALARPVSVGEHELFLTSSIGISLFPEDGRDGPTLLRNADVAMYRAKQDQRGTSQFYTEAMNAQAFERLVLQNDLRRALDRGELVLFYQPLITSLTGRVASVEALVRWQHPERGLLSPNHFIPLAEDTGLILPLGEWVLRQACRQARAWQAAGHSPLSVAVNLSARQFGQRNLADAVQAVLKETRLDARWLTLELTESAIMESRDAAVESLTALKRLGVRLSVDDFGTGYSSLAYLRHFPLDVLKVDRAFVSRLAEDATDQALVRTVIDLAHALGMQVVAEGVETAAQQERLRTLGCDALQGYLFSPPVRAQTVETLFSPPVPPLPPPAADETQP